MTKQTLNELKPGMQAKLIGFDVPSRAFRQKLLSMGLTPGVTLEVIRTAPLGDPMQICVRGFHLSLRKTEAKTIEVEQIA